MKKTLTLVALSSVSGLALAHGGSDTGAHHGFVEGLLHPFTGLDHLAAMLAVGVWSAGSAGRRWIAPLAFVAMLLIGALLSQAGLAPPGIETMIAASLLVIGALLLAPRRPPLAIATALIGGFALFHGAAHGQELAGGPALAGMALGTALLHGLGIALGTALRRQAAWLPRATGLGVALFGLGLLA
ncbi:HupE/UreJ family protein [Roseateles violae]|uniref:HupE/UreJ family protein n=1 Tax=Roseateles violae TaxID=3058042 RepID=A0ABT8DYP8_9BURK|nr:HupE/UreJ family protein [Pelomonas sp. PFR6]MDN3922702.1 HupE/UreJ family protein [Pelomonas sp. PFR6]